MRPLASASALPVPPAPRVAAGLACLAAFGVAVSVGCTTTETRIHASPALPMDDASVAADDTGGGDAGDREITCTSLASAFAKGPTSYALPAPRCGESFTAFGASGDVAHSMLDMNGDRRPDLVITRDACDTDVGTRHWDVYLAGDEGFGKAPTPYSLPAARCGETFDAPYGTGDLRYMLLDVDGDRRADLVVTKDSCDADVGSKRWDVYAAGDGGFARTPTPYTLPAARCSVSFDSASAGSSSLRYALVDLDADRRPDLVVTKDSCDADVGSKRWDVYAAGDGGFAKTPTPHTLPAARCAKPFDAFASSSEVAYLLFDVDADRRPDLVVTRDACDAEVGAKRWDVYAATTAGFAKSPAAYALPAGRCGGSFDATAKDGEVRWSLLDLSCDGRSDLVVTSDGCDTEVGAKRWDVYVASEAGFAKAPSSIALPAARCAQPFDRLASGVGGGVSFGLLDTSADGRGDLVVTQDECDADVGVSRWDAYTLD